VDSRWTLLLNSDQSSSIHAGITSDLPCA